jgi:hypothetical protein
MPPEPADMHADDGAFDRADRNSYSALGAHLTANNDAERRIVMVIGRHPKMRVSMRKTA